MPTSSLISTLLRCGLFVALCLPASCLLAGDQPARNALPGIVFVGGPVLDRHTDQYVGAYHWRDGYVYPKGATYNSWERTHSAPRPGRNLFSLIPATPDGKLTQLTFLENGSVYDPEPSFDGKRVLFSLRQDNDDWYHLYEINLDGTGLRQLTDGPFNDVSGTYLPDGRIVFCSDRTGVLDEYHEERSEFLFRMNADGTGIEQLTFVPGTYFEPTILSNGMILCSFWDAFQISVPPFIKHETYLITLRPDGTEERHLFGAGEYQYYNRTRHSAIGLTKPGELPDGRILVQSEMGPSIYDPNIGTDLRAALAPIFPATTSVQTGGTTFRTHLSPLGTRSTPYPLQDGRFLMAATLPGSRDFGLYVVDPTTRAMTLLYDRPNLSEWDPVPVGLERPIPKTLPDKQRDKQSKFATYLIVSGRQGDTAERNELNRRARYVRVLQAEYTELAVSSHTSLETRVLGTVPIQPDGSIAFEAPAETPIFLESMDARGNRLVLQGGYMAARAGEIKSCFGCHAPQDDAVPNPTLQALKLSTVRVTRESSDLSYRRNESEEYRRQSLILEAPRYREWLSSPQPEIRRRGLEMLGYLPDEVTTADRQRFCELLHDSTAEVRRQAAFTLSTTGSADAIPALLKGLDDEDWQTRSYTAMALEAITGENLELAADVEQAPAVWKKWWQQTGTVEAFLKSLTARGGKFADDFGRDAWLEVVARTRWLGPSSHSVAETQREAWRTRVRELLQQEPPPVAVVHAAGMLADPQAVALIAPWLVRGQKVPKEETIPDSAEALAREVKGSLLAKEAAISLGRIGTPEAVTQLWDVLARTVPNRAPIATRHYQTGPRPEEYTYLRALIYAGATPDADHVRYVIGLMPSTFGEKPRFEDRVRQESQRVLLPRILLIRAGLREPIVQLAAQVLEGTADVKSPLYQQVLAGVNNDRPYSEHGHAFPVLKQLAAEQALHLLNGLALSRAEIPEAAILPLLRTDPQSKQIETDNRVRIEAAAIFRRLGMSEQVEAVLLEEAARPYTFREIWSIGKGSPDTEYRDKAYLIMAVAAHTSDLSRLTPFTDYHRFYRDIRLGLAIGLGFRKQADAGPLLQKLAADPIFAVHRECENAAICLTDAELFAGRTPPPIALPAYEPLKPEYRVQQTTGFARRTPDPTSVAGSIVLDFDDPQVLVKALQSAVDPKQYRNVGNSFAQNAQRMRLADAGELSRILESKALLQRPMSPELEQAMTAALDSPFPFAHYLVTRLIALRGDRQFIPKMVQKLPGYVEQADTVGFYWLADALGWLRAHEALPVLAKFAVPGEYARTYGPVGMAYGFAAARGIGMIADDMHRQEITRLLASENLWLRAGVLDGLVEQQDQKVVQALRQILNDPSTAFLEEEARYGLRRLDHE